jgi:hypothetical protein
MTRTEGLGSQAMNAAQAETLERLVENLLAEPELEDYHAEIEFLALEIDDGLPDRLQQFYGRVSNRFDAMCIVCADDLVKCVGVDRFLMRYASDDVRAEFAFRPNDAYADELARTPADERDERLTEDLPTDPHDILILAPYSWMIPLADLDGRDAADVIAYLRLRNVDAPLVRLELPVPRLGAAGVVVRSPNAFDTIPAFDDVWIRGAVPNELIDRHVIRDACEGARWLD